MEEVVKKYHITLENMTDEKKSGCAFSVIDWDTDIYLITLKAALISLYRWEAEKLGKPYKAGDIEFDYTSE